MKRTRTLIAVLISFCLLGVVGAPAQEKSVRPGINTAFENPDLNEFLKRLEGESREVAASANKIVAACKLRPGMTVADVGAGTGLFTRQFAAEVGETGKVYAVDIAPKFLDYIKKTCADSKINHVETIQCDQFSTKLPKNSVDFVFICDTYHHFEFPQRTLQSIHDALRPGGKLVLIDFQRIEGKSSDFVMGHVRAGKEVFVGEVQSAAFKVIHEEELLKENYFIEFEKVGQRAKSSPTTVQELYADFDPRKDPLDVQLVREWEDEGIRYRYVTYHIGTFKGTKARMAAFYAFPPGGTKLPALMHMHGGGQRAFLHEVTFYARRGYACLSVNWGGREMENAKPGDPNTDWGAVDPTQHNVPGYANLLPGEKYLDPAESPRNNNWYLLTLGCRRGLTFLEQQPEVDPDRLGIYGHSMGGNLTVYVAGTDDRVKAAAPSVGGSGFRTEPWPLLPQQKRQMPNGDAGLFQATIDFESYAPRITAPLLWLGSTNDFHGIMDDTYRTGDLIPHQQVRYSFAPHLNHRFTPEFSVTRPLWMDQYLKKSFAFPNTPQSSLSLSTSDGVPEFTVTPDTSQPVQEVRILYAVDPHPVARFWRSAPAERKGRGWTAKLPILSVAQPLFAFSNVYYPLDAATPSAPQDRATKTFAISSKLHTVTPKDVEQSGAKATDAPSLLIDDFAHGFQDWYLLSADNPHHWEFSTRKISDPKWRGPAGSRLTLDVQSENPNQLVIVMTDNFFRSYRGKQQEFVAVVKLPGGAEWQTVSLEPLDFRAADGDAPMSSWQDADILSLRAYHDKGKRLIGSKAWQGPQPKMRNLRWSSK